MRPDQTPAGNTISIECHPIREADGTRSREEHGVHPVPGSTEVVAKVRRSRGRDIDAACGKLRIYEYQVSGNP